MSVLGRDEGERCPKCGKPSASPPAEVYCVECATGGWQEDAIAHLRHQLAGAVEALPPLWRCPDCGAWQHHAGRCRNNAALEADERVMVEEFPVNQLAASAATALRVLYDNCAGLANDDEPDVEAAVRLARSLPPSRYARGQ